MAYNIGGIFQDYERMIKVKTKTDYANFTATFKEQSMSALSEILDDIDGASTIDEVAESYAEDAFNFFAKKGKVRSSMLANINYQMIYYVFPTILAVRTEDGNAICDAIRDAWNKKFGCNINYADYDTLDAGFITKLFGIPIGAIGFGK